MRKAAAIRAMAVSLTPAFALAAMSLFIHQSAFAHAHILPTGSIPPRDPGTAFKVGPCGGIARLSAGAAKVLTPGTRVTLQFEETIDHPGYYSIAYACGGSASDTPAQSVFDAGILVPMVTDIQGGTLPHEYSASFTVPDVNCQYGTIQLIQYMTEITPPSLYYSCADISITATTNPTPGASSSPTPAVPPVANPDCP